MPNTTTPAVRSLERDLYAPVSVAGPSTRVRLSLSTTPPVPCESPNVYDPLAMVAVHGAVQMGVHAATVTTAAPPVACPRVPVEAVEAMPDTSPVRMWNVISGWVDRSVRGAPVAFTVSSGVAAGRGACVAAGAGSPGAAGMRDAGPA